MNLNISDIISHASNPEDIFELIELLGFNILIQNSKY